MKETPMNEQESLQLITDMIGKVKKDFNETGASAILWGSVVAVCGLVTFAELRWDFRIGFDVWILTMFAFIPQIFITIRERRQRLVRSYTKEAVSAIWMVYTLSMFSLVFYFNTVPQQSDRLLHEASVQLLLHDADGSNVPFHMFIPSAGSLLLLLFGIPTMATGLAYRFRPMLVGAACCYAFFAVSCFTSNTYDYLLCGLAGIANWLIPGLVLRRKYHREKRATNV